MKKGIIIALFIVLLLIASCKNSNNPAIPDTRSYLLGIDPVPRNYPDSTTPDIINKYNVGRDVAEIILTKLDWIRSSDGDGNLKGFLETETKVTNGLNLISLWEITPSVLKNDTGIYVMGPYGYTANSFGDKQYREGYTRYMATYYAAQFQPEYFSLAYNIDYYYQMNKLDFPNFVSLYKETYDAIKNVSPNTKVFVSFDYDNLKKNNLFNIIGMFGDKLDAVMFYSFPLNHFDSLDKIPDDYYSEIGNRRVIIVTGAPSLLGNEELQIKYLYKFLGLSSGLNKEAIVWSTLHDITQQYYGNENTYYGLKTTDGKNKKIYDVWKKLKNTPYAAK